MNDLVVLQDFYQDKLSTLLRHISGARSVRQYDANNTYQYIISREETQLSWVGQAIVDLGEVLPPTPSEPEYQSKGAGADPHAIIEVDSREAQAFVDRWRPRVAAMTNARNRAMLGVVLGETLEQKRFFDQALAGSVDLLGRRSLAVGARVGEVLPTRWRE